MSQVHDSKLLRVLKARQITQWDLALKVGMHPSRLNRVVHGQALPTTEQAIAIAREVGATVEDLWGEAA